MKTVHCIATLCVALLPCVIQAQVNSTNSTSAPTLEPTLEPSTLSPTTQAPSFSPSVAPTLSPTSAPSRTASVVEPISAEALGISVLTYLGVFMICGWGVFEGLRSCSPTSFVYSTRFRKPETTNPLEAETETWALGWVSRCFVVVHVAVLARKVDV